MKMSASDQVFNLFPQLDAVIGSVSMIPVEIFHVALLVGPMTLRPSGECIAEVNIAAAA